MSPVITFIIAFVVTSNALPSKISDVMQGGGEAVVDDLKIAEHKIIEEWNEIRRVAMDTCRCTNFNCGCCAHLEESEIHLNSTICANVSYLSHDYGISITVTVNDYTIFNETVSARNPPPVCIGVPYVKEYADACVRLYDIDATTTHLHACVRVEARMKKILIAKYELGCFNIGPPGLSKMGNAGSMATSNSKHKEIKLKEHQTSEETNAANFVTFLILTVTVLTGLTAVVILGVIALTRKKESHFFGTSHVKGLGGGIGGTQDGEKVYCKGKQLWNYGSLATSYDDDDSKC
ncbi:uncharacterized protein LOC110828644 isoform X2 [Zootermopsis nevadensis]|uniref:uncharacterized protein LOC110828644 isoform X2 n=1 Tax=Zootermopsis nevadensis TaxID=136037 RepID=UPI000B8EA8EF|nr:uncharacterized protein LOC110828644 isoform X2 [Zootermopsis nevadensis]